MIGPIMQPNLLTRQKSVLQELRTALRLAGLWQFITVAVTVVVKKEHESLRFWHHGGAVVHGGLSR